MKCLYCTADLPVDSNNSKVNCPKCGSEYYITGHGRAIPTDDLEDMHQLEHHELRPIQNDNRRIP